MKCSPKCPNHSSGPRPPANRKAKAMRIMGAAHSPNQRAMPAADAAGTPAADAFTMGGPKVNPQDMQAGAFASIRAPHLAHVNIVGCSIVGSNVRGHRADEMKDATVSAASEAPGGPRC